MSGLPDFEIIAGSYEEFLLGYKIHVKNEQSIQSFAAHDHSSSIRCLALGTYYLASGGADDRIIVYDLRVRKEHCMLTHHTSTITSLQFTNNQSHIISASADGVLAIVRIGNWQVEKLWDKAHKGLAILDVALHSSGKLALTLGADQSLRTWNLVKGRQAYAINLNSKSKDAKSLEKIVWGPDDVHFILYGGKYTEIWSIESGGIDKCIEHEEKVTSCIWLKDNIILVGYEDGKLCTLNIDDETKEIIQGHTLRVKALASYKKWVISAASNGEIKIWNKHMNEMMKIDTGCRLTCLRVVPNIEMKNEFKNEEAEVVEEKSPQSVKSARVVITIGDNDKEEDVTVVNKPAKALKRKKEKQLYLVNNEEKKVKVKKNKKKKIKENAHSE